ncbi:polysaccharide biosynthesis tyrosine autokinase [Nocardioides mesophilus]|uniref:non-specific protein-tyrosine kinase n=1 Tax=Nocardioides mesophilus TaxID=433659 RepID=A0A7G9REJ4_9ACTN|nr:polysaccharide biosynthesis tyrosine autokinase [Nocardioides mesophilus]QNN54019.1 polysaccharide biosynthesis tyrosine autokinase [Nocardioides mesophilus]
MELRDYLRVIRRRWLLIVSCVLVVVGVAAAVTFTATPIYQSTARLFVSTPDQRGDSAYQGSLFSIQRVASYAELASDRELARRVIKDLGLDLEPEALADKVTATVKPETVILEIQVTDPDPKRAQKLAQTLAEEVADYIAEIETPPGRANAPIKASLVGTATVPNSPISPQPVRNLGLGLVLGLLLGLGLAVLRELLDTSVKGPADIAEITETPVLGGILFDSQAPKRPLLTQLDSHSPRVEAFRILRTNLQFVDVDQDKKVIVFTSSVPGEGKTSTATNIALALHTAGQRTLLIDADMRRPQLAKLFDLEPAVGLTTVLLGRIDLADAIQVHADSGLAVLASGNLPPNPAELLQSQAMKVLLEEVREDYDVVVLDAPPLLPVTDAAIIASQVDGAVIVVRQGKTTRDQFGHSLERLEAVGARSLGVAMNMVPAKRRQGGYSYGGYGYGGYGYGYAPEGRRRKKS